MRLEGLLAFILLSEISTVLWAGTLEDKQRRNLDRFYQGQPASQIV